MRRGLAAGLLALGLGSAGCVTVELKPVIEVPLEELRSAADWLWVTPCEREARAAGRDEKACAD